MAEQPITVTVEGGRCARWTVRWDLVGDDGARVRPGDYFVTVGIAISRPADAGTGDPQSQYTRYVLRISG